MSRRIAAYLTTARIHMLNEDAMRAHLAKHLPATDCSEHVDRTPVVLVHGYLARKSWWLKMITRLHEDGFSHVRAAAYNVFEHGLEDAAQRVHDKVVRVADEHGVDKVSVVAHSMGSLATLFAATRLGLDDRLEKVVTLGGPYGGSPMANLARLPVAQVVRTARQLAPSSKLLAELRDEASGLTVPWRVLYSTRDELVPVRYAQLAGPAVTCEQVAPVGHVEMLLSRRVAAKTSAALATA